MNTANRTLPTTTRLMPATVFELRPRELLGDLELPLVGEGAGLGIGDGDGDGYF